MPLISNNAIERRLQWIAFILKTSRASVNFDANTHDIQALLTQEIEREGANALVDHLRLCGDIPEGYRPDSSEEKLYSKYTDILISEAFKSIGLQSIVVKQRGDAADVEAYADGYSLVADAKSFRLSRTAKNQKDFKVQALHKWRYGHPYALVIVPIYQLPRKSSQIYQQAITSNVGILSYSHLILLVLARQNGIDAAALLLEVFKTLSLLNPSKDAYQYWMGINKTFLDFADPLKGLWDLEKQAAAESLITAKEMALRFLSDERQRIMQLSRSDAIAELIQHHRIDSRINFINAISDSAILDIS